MRRIRFDRFAIQLANGAFVGVGRVGGTHYFAILQDGIFAFQNLNHNRARGHELNQIREERAFLVNAIKLFGLLGCHVNAFLCHDPQTCIFQHCIDFAGQIATGRIRFDNRKCLFQSHGVSLPLSWKPRQAAPCVFETR